MSKVIELAGPLAPVSFRTQGLQPPSDLYVDANDALFITSYNAASGLRLDVRAILLRTDGVAVPIELRHVPNTDRTSKTDVFPLTQGFLLSCSVFLGAGSSKRGQTYIQVGVARGFQSSRVTHRLLLQGYTATTVTQTWPGSAVEHPLDGPGYARDLTGTNPAAGVEISETVPTGARWRLHGIKANLITDATVANRRPILLVAVSSVNVIASQQPQTIAASLNRDVFWSPGLSWETGIAGIDLVAGLPLNVPLLAGWVISTTTVSLQAGDNWGAPEMIVEEWIEP